MSTFSLFCVFRYGDRFPKTIIGRSIAILWFLTGIVLSSLLISSLTSSMSVRILDQHLNVARGKKVTYCNVPSNCNVLLLSYRNQGTVRGGSVVKWLEARTRNLEAPGSSPFSVHKLDLFRGSPLFKSSPTLCK